MANKTILEQAKDIVDNISSSPISNILNKSAERIEEKIFDIDTTTDRLLEKVSITDKDSSDFNAKVYVKTYKDFLKSLGDSNLILTNEKSASAKAVKSIKNKFSLIDETRISQDIDDIINNAYKTTEDKTVESAKLPKNKDATAAERLAQQEKNTKEISKDETGDENKITTEDRIKQAKEYQAQQAENIKKQVHSTITNLSADEFEKLDKRSPDEIDAENKDRYNKTGVIFDKDGALKEVNAEFAVEFKKPDTEYIFNENTTQGHMEKRPDAYDNTIPVANTQTEQFDKNLLDKSKESINKIVDSFTIDKEPDGLSEKDGMLYRAWLAKQEGAKVNQFEAYYNERVNELYQDYKNRFSPDYDDEDKLIYNLSHNLVINNIVKDKDTAQKVAGLLIKKGVVNNITKKDILYTISSLRISDLKSSKQQNKKYILDKYSEWEKAVMKGSPIDTIKLYGLDVDKIISDSDIVKPDVSDDSYYSRQYDAHIKQQEEDQANADSSLSSYYYNWENSLKSLRDKVLQDDELSSVYDINEIDIMISNVQNIRDQRYDLVKGVEGVSSSSSSSDNLNNSISYINGLYDTIVKKGENTIYGNTIVQEFSDSYNRLYSYSNKMYSYIKDKIDSNPSLNNNKDISIIIDRIAESGDVEDSITDDLSKSQNEDDVLAEANKSTNDEVISLRKQYESNKEDIDKLLNESFGNDYNKIATFVSDYNDYLKYKLNIQNNGTASVSTMSKWNAFYEQNKDVISSYKKLLSKSEDITNSLIVKSSTTQKLQERLAEVNNDRLDLIESLINNKDIQSFFKDDKDFMTLMSQYTSDKDYISKNGSTVREQLSNVKLKQDNKTKSIQAINDGLYNTYNTGLSNLSDMSNSLESAENQDSYVEKMRNLSALKYQDGLNFRSAINPVQQEIKRQINLTGQSTKLTDADYFLSKFSEETTSVRNLRINKLMKDGKTREEAEAYVGSTGFANMDAYTEGQILRDSGLLLAVNVAGKALGKPGMVLDMFKTFKVMGRTDLGSLNQKATNDMYQSVIVPFVQMTIDKMVDFDKMTTISSAYASFKINNKEDLDKMYNLVKNNTDVESSRYAITSVYGLIQDTNKDGIISYDEFAKQAKVSQYYLLWDKLHNETEQREAIIDSMADSIYNNKEYRSKYTGELLTRNKKFEEPLYNISNLSTSNEVFKSIFNIDSSNNTIQNAVDYIKKAVNSSDDDWKEKSKFIARYEFYSNGLNDTVVSFNKDRKLSEYFSVDQLKNYQAQYKEMRENNHLIIDTNEKVENLYLDNNSTVTAWYKIANMNGLKTVDDNGNVLPIDEIIIPKDKAIVLPDITSLNYNNIDIVTDTFGFLYGTAYEDLPVLKMFANPSYSWKFQNEHPLTYMAMDMFLNYSIDDAFNVVTFIGDGITKNLLSNKKIVPVELESSTVEGLEARGTHINAIEHEVIEGQNKSVFYFDNDFTNNLRKLPKNILGETMDGIVSDIKKIIPENALKKIENAVDYATQIVTKFGLNTKEMDEQVKAKMGEVLQDVNSRNSFIEFLDSMSKEATPMSDTWWNIRKLRSMVAGLTIIDSLPPRFSRVVKQISDQLNMINEFSSMYISTLLNEVSSSKDIYMRRLVRDGMDVQDIVNKATELKTSLYPTIKSEVTKEFNSRLAKYLEQSETPDNYEFAYKELLKDDIKNGVTNAGDAFTSSPEKYFDYSLNREITNRINKQLNKDGITTDLIDKIISGNEKMPDFEFTKQYQGDTKKYILNAFRKYIENPAYYGIDPNNVTDVELRALELNDSIVGKLLQEAGLSKSAFVDLVKTVGANRAIREYKNNIFEAKQYIDQYTEIFKRMITDKGLLYSPKANMFLRILSGYEKNIYISTKISDSDELLERGFFYSFNNNLKVDGDSITYTKFNGDVDKIKLSSDDISMLSNGTNDGAHSIITKYKLYDYASVINPDKVGDDFIVRKDPYSIFKDEIIKSTDGILSDIVNIKFQSQNKDQDILDLQAANPDKKLGELYNIYIDNVKSNDNIKIFSGNKSYNEHIQSELLDIENIKEFNHTHKDLDLIKGEAVDGLTFTNDKEFYDSINKVVKKLKQEYSGDEKMIDNVKDVVERQYLNNKYIRSIIQERTRTIYVSEKHSFVFLTREEAIKKGLILPSGPQEDELGEYIVDFNNTTNSTTFIFIKDSYTNSITGASKFVGGSNGAVMDYTSFLVKTRLKTFLDSSLTKLGDYKYNDKMSVYTGLDLLKTIYYNIESSKFKNELISDYVHTQIDELGSREIDIKKLSNIYTRIFTSIVAKKNNPDIYNDYINIMRTQTNRTSAWGNLDIAINDLISNKDFINTKEYKMIENLAANTLVESDINSFRNDIMYFFNTFRQRDNNIKSGLIFGAEDSESGTIKQINMDLLARLQSVPGLINSGVKFDGYSTIKKVDSETIKYIVDPDVGLYVANTRQQIPELFNLITDKLKISRERKSDIEIRDEINNRVSEISHIVQKEITKFDYNSNDLSIELNVNNVSTNTAAVLLNKRASDIQGKDFIDELKSKGLVDNAGNIKIYKDTANIVYKNLIIDKFRDFFIAIDSRGDMSSKLSDNEKLNLESIRVQGEQNFGKRFILYNNTPKDKAILEYFHKNNFEYGNDYIVVDIPESSDSLIKSVAVKDGLLGLIMPIVSSAKMYNDTEFRLKEASANRSFNKAFDEIGNRIQSIDNPEISYDGISLTQRSMPAVTQNGVEYLYRSVINRILDSKPSDANLELSKYDTFFKQYVSHRALSENISKKLVGKTNSFDDTSSIIKSIANEIVDKYPELRPYIMHGNSVNNILSQSIRRITNDVYSSMSNGKIYFKKVIDPDGLITQQTKIEPLSNYDKLALELDSDIVKLSDKKISRVKFGTEAYLDVKTLFENNGVIMFSVKNGVLGNAKGLRIPDKILNKAPDGMSIGDFVREQLRTKDSDVNKFINSFNEKMGNLKEDEIIKRINLFDDPHTMGTSERDVAHFVVNFPKASQSSDYDEWLNVRKQKFINEGFNEETSTKLATESFDVSIADGAIYMPKDDIEYIRESLGSNNKEYHLIKPTFSKNIDGNEVVEKGEISMITKSIEKYLRNIGAWEEIESARKSGKIVIISDSNNIKVGGDYINSLYGEKQYAYFAHNNSDIRYSITSGKESSPSLSLNIVDQFPSITDINVIIPFMKMFSPGITEASKMIDNINEHPEDWIKFIKEKFPEYIGKKESDDNILETITDKEDMQDITEEGGLLDNTSESVMYDSSIRLLNNNAPIPILKNRYMEIVVKLVTDSILRNSKVKSGYIKIVPPDFEYDSTTGKITIGISRDEIKMSKDYAEHLNVKDGDEVVTMRYPITDKLSITPLKVVITDEPISSCMLHPDTIKAIEADFDGDAIILYKVGGDDGISKDFADAIQLNMSSRDIDVDGKKYYTPNLTVGIDTPEAKWKSLISSDNEITKDVATIIEKITGQENITGRKWKDVFPDYGKELNYNLLQVLNNISIDGKNGIAKLAREKALYSILLSSKDFKIGRFKIDISNLNKQEIEIKQVFQACVDIMKSSKYATMQPESKNIIAKAFGATTKKDFKEFKSALKESGFDQTIKEYNRYQGLPNIKYSELGSSVISKRDTLSEYVDYGTNMMYKLFNLSENNNSIITQSNKAIPPRGIIPLLLKNGTSIFNNESLDLIGIKDKFNSMIDIPDKLLKQQSILIANEIVNKVFSKEQIANLNIYSTKRSENFLDQLRAFVKTSNEKSTELYIQKKKLESRYKDKTDQDYIDKLSNINDSNDELIQQNREQQALLYNSYNISKFTDGEKRYISVHALIDKDLDVNGERSIFSDKFWNVITDDDQKLYFKIVNDVLSLKSSTLDKSYSDTTLTKIQQTKLIEGLSKTKDINTIVENNKVTIPKYEIPEETNASLDNINVGFGLNYKQLEDIIKNPTFDNIMKTYSSEKSKSIRGWLVSEFIKDQTSGVDNAMFRSQWELLVNNIKSILGITEFTPVQLKDRQEIYDSLIGKAGSFIESANKTNSVDSDSINLVNSINEISQNDFVKTYVDRVRNIDSLKDNANYENITNDIKDRIDELSSYINNKSKLFESAKNEDEMISIDSKIQSYIDERSALNKFIPLLEKLQIFNNYEKITLNEFIGNPPEVFLNKIKGLYEKSLSISGKNISKSNSILSKRTLGTIEADKLQDIYFNPEIRSLLDVWSVNQINTSRLTTKYKLSQFLNEAKLKKVNTYILDSTGTLKQEDLNKISDNIFLIEIPDRIQNLKRLSDTSAYALTDDEIDFLSLLKSKFNDSFNIFGYSNNEKQLDKLIQIRKLFIEKAFNESEKNILGLVNEQYKKITSSTYTKFIPGEQSKYQRSYEMGDAMKLMGADQEGRITFSSLIKSAADQTRRELANSYQNQLMAQLVNNDFVHKVSSNLRDVELNLLILKEKKTPLSASDKAVIADAVRNKCKLYVLDSVNKYEQDIINFAKSIDNNVSINKIKSSSVNDNINMLLTFENSSSMFTGQRADIFKEFKLRDKKGINGTITIYNKTSEELEHDVMGYISQEISKWSSDKNKLPPGFITEKSKQKFVTSKELLQNWVANEERLKLKDFAKKRFSDIAYQYKIDLIETQKELNNNFDLTPLQYKEINKKIEKINTIVRLISDNVLKLERNPGTIETLRRRLMMQTFEGLSKSINGNEKEYNQTIDLKVKDTILGLMDLAQNVSGLVKTATGAVQSAWIYSILLLRPAFNFWNAMDDGIKVTLATQDAMDFAKIVKMYFTTSEKASINTLKTIANAITGKDYGLFDIKKLNGDEKTIKKIAELENHLEIYTSLDSPYGYKLTQEDWDSIKTNGNERLISDYNYASRLFASIDDDTFRGRMKKFFTAYISNKNIYTNQLEEMRRSLLAHEMIFKKAKSALEAEATVNLHLFDYRDLTKVEQIYRKIFPFYTFNAKSFHLYTELLKKRGGMKFLRIGMRLVDHIEDQTKDVPEKYKNRIKILGRYYWLPNFSVIQYFQMLKDPYSTLKQTIDNPYRNGFNLSMNPWITSIVDQIYRKGLPYTEYSVSDLPENNYTDAEIYDQIKENEKNIQDKIDSMTPMDQAFAFLTTFIPPIKLITNFWNVSAADRMRSNIVISSKAIRELSKFFGINILSVDDATALQDKIFSLPPSQRTYFQKKLVSENSEEYLQLTEQWLLGAIYKIQSNKTLSEDEQTDAIFAKILNTLYFDSNSIASGKKILHGSGTNTFAEIYPDLVEPLKKLFDSEYKDKKEGLLLIFNDFINGNGMRFLLLHQNDPIIGDAVKQVMEDMKIPKTIKQKIYLEQVENQDLTSLINQTLKDFNLSSKAKIDKMKIMGIEPETINAIDQNTLRNMLLDETTGKAKVTEEQFIKIMDDLGLNKWYEENSASIRDYLDNKQTEKNLRTIDEKNAYNKKVADYVFAWNKVSSVLPDNINEMSEDEASKYWTVFYSLRDKYILSDPDYKDMYMNNMSESERKYYDMNEQYLAMWSNRPESDTRGYFEWFFKQPKWFQQIYYYNHPGKEQSYSNMIPYLDWWESLIDIKNKNGITAYLDAFFDKSSEVYRNKYESSHPGAIKAYQAWREYNLINNETWEGRQQRKQFLKDNPILEKWWNRNKTDADLQKNKKIEEYYKILDSIDPNDSSKDGVMKYYKAKAEASEYLDNNPNLFSNKSSTGYDSKMKKLNDTYWAMTTTQDRNALLNKYPELSDWWADKLPPGIRKLNKLEKVYFKLSTNDLKQAFLKRYPELLNYWDIKRLPQSYFTDYSKFKPYQDIFDRANRYFSLITSHDYSFVAISNKLFPTSIDTSTDEGKWLFNKIYTTAMSTWASTFGSTMSTVYFRSLPQYIRDYYFTKHPDSKLLSTTSLSNILSYGLKMQDSNTSDLAWARAQQYKYGKNIPKEISYKVYKILAKYHKTEDRSGWSREKWTSWYSTRTMAVNKLLPKYLKNNTLLKNEIDKVANQYPLLLNSMSMQEIGDITKVFNKRKKKGMEFNPFFMGDHVSV